MRGCHKAGINDDPGPYFTAISDLVLRLWNGKKWKKNHLSGAVKLSDINMAFNSTLLKFKSSRSFGILAKDHLFVICQHFKKDFSSRTT